MKQALGSSASPVEREWIGRIETIRRLLGTSRLRFEVEDLSGSDDHGTRNRAAGPRASRTIGEMTRSSKPKRWSYLLFRLVRAVQPRTCLELGSCVGISASYQAAALELNGVGRLVTLEGNEALAQRTARTIEELDLQDRARVVTGPFSETLSPVLKDMGRVDWAFVDGNHREEPTVEYSDLIIKSAAAEAVVVFDDIHWSAGMSRAWQAITSDERYALTVDLGAMGIAVISESATCRRHIGLSYS